jgi:tRNA(His) 5'-end guanylyltransferase
MKQTAVEWIQTRAEEREKNNPQQTSYWHLRELQKDFEQTKEMEKQQIIDSYEDGINKGRHEDGEQYYNDTFNK